MENTKNKPNNPYAFACCDDGRYLQEGMTLRDYFAAKAMQAYISHFDRQFVRDFNYSEHFGVSELSYKVADAMLKQREL